MHLGIVVEVAGRKMQADFEPVLERQIHYFVNGAEGIQHIGQRDITWIRVSTAPSTRAFACEHIGKILHARIHDVFGTIVDKVQVTLITDEAPIEELLDEARAAYKERNERMANLTDESVDKFYSCLLCQSFAPNHVCVVNPERLGLCGAYNWLDCKASYEINPTGPNQPVPKGIILDPVKGEFSGPNEFVYQNSQPDGRAGHLLLDHGGAHDRLRLLRVHHDARARGQRRHDREPRGPEHDALRHDLLDAGRHGRRRHADAGHDGHGQVLPDQPEVHLGRRRLQARRLDELASSRRRWPRPCRRSASARAMPDLLDRIADETICTDVEELLPFLEEKGHPALTMDPLF